jgi:hypothetical protein
LSSEYCRLYGLFRAKVMDEKRCNLLSPEEVKPDGRAD